MSSSWNRLILLLALFPVLPSLADSLPETPLEDALKEAAGENRAVLVDVSADWCPWCQKQDRTWDNADVKAWIADCAVPVKIDSDKEKDLVARLGVKGYPTLLLMKPDGTEIGRMRGYRPPDVFLEEARALFSRSGLVVKKREKPKEIHAGGAYDGVVYLKSGGRFEGRITETEKGLDVKTRFGKVSAAREQIASVSRGGASAPLSAPSPAQAPGLRDDGIPVSDREAVLKGFEDYRSAMRSGSLEKLKGCVASDKRKELDGPQAEEMLRMAKAMSPAVSKVTVTSTDGSKASLALEGAMQDGTKGAGTMTLVREEGRWVVSEEHWKITMP